jgi:glycosyltransferase involved in cell wall biosynthesis
LSKDITTIIPTYFDSGVPFSRFISCLESVGNQTIKPSKIIITDDSKDSELIKQLKEILKDFQLPILYTRNSNDRGMGSNSNNGLAKATTRFVHILHSDDCLSNNHAYEKMLDKISESPSGWVFSGGRAAGNEQNPKVTKYLIFGINTLGGPSGLFALRENYLSYDTRLKMLVDVEQYSRILQEFGPPLTIDEPLIDYGVGNWQVQNNIKSREIVAEYIYILEKYPESRKILQEIQETTRDTRLQMRLALLDLIYIRSKPRHRILLEMATFFLVRVLKKLKKV